ncbi:MAG: aminotransferase class V-fold PLP-dependent enzyme [Candidatus Adiutrix sp.]|jgi:cysteine desulfurase family protein|nr:aminotransferase class V-fold PLP-dependent enzyme [Candidatus Adiutrix sp.]
MTDKGGPLIYLDNAATSFPKPPEVVEAIRAALLAPASPGRSGHAASLAAARAIHQARKNVARLFGVEDNSRLVFTANITWALNLALEGLGLKAGDHILSSSLEHNSVARPLARLAAERGVIWERVPLDGEGLSDPAEFRKLRRSTTKLVVLNQASNVTGALAPAREIKEAVGEVPLLLDTAQTAGAMDLSDLGQWADLVAFTGHKGLLGPTGTGGLWLKPGLRTRPLATGGTGSASESLIQPDFLPDALEPGTANTHGLAGLAAGAGFILETGADQIRQHELGLATAFLDGLSQIPGLTVWGPQNPARRVATISVSLAGWSCSDLSSALEQEAAILTRAGLHCAPLVHQTLGTLAAGGLTRFSFGFFNTLEEIKTALTTLDKLARRKD